MSTASLVGNDLLSYLPSSTVKNYNKSPYCFAGYFWSTLCSLPNAANYDHDSSQEVGSGSSLAKFANFKYLSITSSFICLPATMGLAAFNRCMRIVKTDHYNITFSNRRAKFLLGSIWTLLLSYIIVARGTGSQIYIHSWFRYLLGFAYVKWKRNCSL